MTRQEALFLQGYLAINQGKFYVMRDHIKTTLTSALSDDPHVADDWVAWANRNWKNATESLYQSLRPIKVNTVTWADYPQREIYSEPIEDGPTEEASNNLSPGDFQLQRQQTMTSKVLPYQPDESSNLLAAGDRSDSGESGSSGGSGSNAGNATSNIDTADGTFRIARPPRGS